MLVELRSRPFNAWREIDSCQSRLRRTGQHGAVASFVGIMRDFNEDRRVTGMMLEHYPEMTEKYLKKIAAHTAEKWQLIELLLLHRIGRINIGEHIVIVATWAAHRKQALESCHTLVEDLKSRAPFWKKEETPDGDRWVEKNTPG